MFDDSDPEVVRSNGNPYFVGYDDYGWFSIVHAVPDPETDGYMVDPDLTPDGRAQFPPAAAEDIIEIIEAGLGD